MAKKNGPKKLMLTASLNMGPEDWYGLMSVMSCHFTTVIIYMIVMTMMVYRNNVSNESPCSGTHKMLGVTPHKT